MNNVRDKKRANKSLPFFFRTEFKVFFTIILVSTILLISTFSFDTVPPILNRGIQPATFPKGLLVLIIALTSIIYYLSFKKPWKKEKKMFPPSKNNMYFSSVVTKVWRISTWFAERKKGSTSSGASHNRGAQPRTRDAVSVMGPMDGSTCRLFLGDPA